MASAHNLKIVHTVGNSVSSFVNLDKVLVADNRVSGSLPGMICMQRSRRRCIRVGLESTRACHGGRRDLMTSQFILTLSGLLVSIS